MNIQRRLQDDQQVEVRLAARLTGGLQCQIEQLPHDVTERLRFAREQALVRARSVQRASVAASSVAPVALTAQGTAVMGGFMPWWQRAAMALPLAVLVVGLVAIDRWTVREQVIAAADFDAQLLADDLPPAAYSDPGFAEYLRTESTP